VETASAVALANRLIYKPGWQITAEDHTNRFEGTIKVRIDYPAQNSNRDQAEQGYPETIQTYASFPIVVGDCEDDATLYRRILDALVKIEIHEAREFLRVQDSFWAPFHPHRIDGMQRYGAGVLDDLQFGIA
jgi:hypothetical protein